MQSFLRVVTVLVLTSLGCAANAAVVDTAPAGFDIQQTVHIAASPAKVYAALIVPAKWWNSAHTFSQSAANLSLSAKAGGCFCEKWVQGSVEHATVVDAEPGKVLRLRGALGPFQGSGVASALTFTLKKAEGGTDVILDNSIGGYMKGGFGNWPTLADVMLAEQMARLKKYMETGSPE
jgi:uncharacterized protein YndB with AHSA1/START domain